MHMQVDACIRPRSTKVSAPQVLSLSQCLLLTVMGVVITKVQRSVTMLNDAMGVTDDRSTKVGHYVATLAVVGW